MFAFGTPAPAASTSAAATPTVASPTALAAGRRTHKGKVDLHRLVEELGLVGAVDGGAGFLEGRVLDQRVALFFPVVSKFVTHASEGRLSKKAPQKRWCGRKD